MASEFLDNLKNAVDEGKFNSDAAKKINEIGEKSTIVDTENTKIKIEDIPEEVEKTTQYEEVMSHYKKEDLANKQLALILNIENMVEMTIQDMLNHIADIEVQLEKELKEDKLFEEFSKKIVDIKEKYNIFVKTGGKII